MKNKKNICFFCSLLFAINLLPAAILIPGDLNNDGELNIADVVYLQAMVDDVLQKTPEADLNFDGKVDSQDILLLEAALQGDALPSLLAKKIIGRDGGTLSAKENSFVLTIPANALEDNTQIAVSSIDLQVLENHGIDNAALPNAFLLAGLPEADNLEFKFKLPASRSGNNYHLVMGMHTMPRNATEEDWHFQAFDRTEDGISFENEYLVWQPRLIASQESGTRTANDKKNGNIIFSIGKDDSGQIFYESTNFRIQLLTSEISMNEVRQLVEMLKDFEYAHQLAINTLKFPIDRRVAKWGNSAAKIKAVVKKPSKEKLWGLWSSAEAAEDAWCIAPSFWSPPSMEFNTGVISSSSRREIVSHEFFHCLQYYYATNGTTLWLDEMSATWMEGRVSPKGKNYCPSTYKDPRAAINGLFRSSTHRNPNNSGFHGYSVSAFAYYLYKRSDWKDDFWHNVFSHEGYINNSKGMEPLRYAAAKMMPDFPLPLEFLYQSFLRNYLSEGISDGGAAFSAFGSNGLRAFSIFDNIDQIEGDWQRYPQNGRRDIIQKVEDFSGKLEHEFEIQDLGAATWKLIFAKPADVFSEGITLVAEVDNALCDDFFAVIFERSICVAITEIEKITYNREGTKKILEIDLSKYRTLDHSVSVGLVASRTIAGSNDAVNLKKGKMSVSLKGVIELPRDYTTMGGSLHLGAHSDLKLKFEKAGVIGDCYVFKGVASCSVGGGASICGYSDRSIAVMMKEKFPQTLYLKSNIEPLEHDSFEGYTAFGQKYTCSVKADSKVKIETSTYKKGSSSAHTTTTREVEISELATDNFSIILGGNETNVERVSISIWAILHTTRISGQLFSGREVLHCLQMSFVYDELATTNEAPKIEVRRE
jgi:hypothetical protein